MIAALAKIVVIATGLYFIGLSAVCLLAPDKARNFLRKFASSGFAHYLEMTIRIVAGGALITHAPDMAYSGAFNLFGWVLVISSAALLLVPWRWHHRFGQWAIPFAIRILPLFAALSLVLGASILYATFA